MVTRTRWSRIEDYDDAINDLLLAEGFEVRAGEDTTIGFLDGMMLRMTRPTDYAL